MKVLIVEDQSDWCEILSAHVSSLSYTVQCCTSRAQTLDILARQPPDILLADARLADGDLLMDISSIRQRLPSLGIVVLTGRTLLEDQARGMGDGADYYLIKPIKLPTLTATLAALSRRMSTSAHRISQEHRETPLHWTFQGHAGRLTGPQGQTLNFTARESIVFGALLQSLRFPVTHTQLMQALGESPRLVDTSHRIDTLVYRVRQKLRQLQGEPFFIKNVYSEGFVLVTGTQPPVEVTRL
ncbi:response regulator transcription factor [Comamonadaceae bacterium PP-2]